MNQQLQQLIDKIKKEGFQEAQQKAGEIEAQARQRAEQIVADAKREADALIVKACAENEKRDQSTRQALKQAGRDMLLTLRREIDQVLLKIVTRDVQKALTPEGLAAIIQELIKGYAQNKGESFDVEVTLNEKDRQALQDGYLAKLKEACRQPITFRSGDGIRAGFTISFDSGKSSFDFTDESLVGYLGRFLNKDVTALLQESITKK